MKIINSLYQEVAGWTFIKKAVTLWQVVIFSFIYGLLPCQNWEKETSPLMTFLENPLHISIENSETLKEKWVRLSKLSGFPEPYLANRMTTYRRWSNTYAQQLIREDIRDLTGIKSVGDMETLYFLLPSKVGSPLSVQSLVNDLKVSYNSIRGWLAVFERFFLIFSIPPWTVRIARELSKKNVRFTCGMRLV